jgi:diguanylate cyclase (GGDEF)-like protein
MHIVILDSDDASRETLSRILHESGHSVAIARDIVEATSLCSEDSCDLLFLDPSSQPEMLIRIKEHIPDIPVVVMSRNPSIESVIAALRLGTFDYLIKPFDDEEALVEAIERLQGSIEAASSQRAYLKRILKTFSELSFANESVRDQGYTNGTTELYYNQFFEDILEIELARSHRCNHNFTIVSLRLDFLRDTTPPETNAGFHSQVEVITGFLHQRMRRTDVLIRTAANEFMIILVETPKEGGMILVENLCRGMAALVPTEIGRTGPAEGSPPIAIGTAVYPLDGTACQALMEKARIYSRRKDPACPLKF